MAKSKQHGKQGRIERARERAVRPPFEIPREHYHDLGYDAEEGTICLACALKEKNERFIYETESKNFDPDGLCALCGLPFREANTEEAYLEFFCIVTL